MGSSDFAIDHLPESIRQMSLLPETPKQKDVPPSGFQVAHFGTTELLATSFQFPNTRCVAKPPDFVEPRPADIFLRGIPDPDDPTAPPRINPWSNDYFIGDVDIAL